MRSQLTSAAKVGAQLSAQWSDDELASWSWSSVEPLTMAEDDDDLEDDDDDIEDDDLDDDDDDDEDKGDRVDYRAILAEFDPGNDRLN